MVKHYSNGEITVVWRPDLCIHSAICVKGLPLVFDAKRRPWIELHHSDSKTVAAQCDECPSGALTWFRSQPAGS